MNEWICTLFFFWTQMDGLYRCSPFLIAGRSPWPINHTSDFINGLNSHRNCIIFPWPISQFISQLYPHDPHDLIDIHWSNGIFPLLSHWSIGGAGLAKSVPRIDFFQRKLEEKTATKRNTWKNMGHLSFLYPETCVIFLNSEKF